MTLGGVGLLVFAGLVISAAAIGWCARRDDENPPRGWISESVERAIERGEGTVEIRIIDESGLSHMAPLEYVLYEYSAVVAQATGRTVVHVSANAIHTWHVFRLLERVSDPIGATWDCIEAPHSVVLRDNEIAFPFAQGSATIRGVMVSMETENSDVVSCRG